MKPHIIQKNKKAVDPGKVSEYARFFDETSPHWRNDHQLNLFFLKRVEDYANDQLKARGHIFLNEVYDMLGIPRTPKGAIVGWLYETPSDCVEFKMNSDLDNNTLILVDFNVRGVIYEQI